MGVEEDWGEDQRAAIEVVLRLIEFGFNLGELDRLDEWVSQGVDDHASRPGDPPGVEGIKARIRAVREAVADAYLQIEDIMVDGPKVAWRWTVTGTHRGSLFGEDPTGRPVTISGIAMDRVMGGQIVEHWNVTDSKLQPEHVDTNPSRGPPEA